MKAYLLYSVAGLSVIGAMTFLMSLWFDLFTEATVWKIMTSCAVLVVLLGIIIAIREHLSEEDKQKKDGLLN